MHHLIFLEDMKFENLCYKLDIVKDDQYPKPINLSINLKVISIKTNKNKSKLEELLVTDSSQCDIVKEEKPN